MRQDIDLICENALRFNEEDSVYFQTAGKLLRDLDGLFEDATVCFLMLKRAPSLNCFATFM